MAKLKPKIKYQSVRQTSETTNLGLLLKNSTNILHLHLHQPQKKKELQPQRYQVKRFANKFQTWPWHTADRRKHFLVLDLHLVWSPSPLSSWLLSIYWIRKPYSRKRTFSRTQHQHFQYSDILQTSLQYPKEILVNLELRTHKLFPWQHYLWTQRWVSGNTFYFLI